MAKINSLFVIEGTLGGVNFYLRKGIPTARKSGGGFSGKAIKNSPNMVRVRENNSEFGHVSRLKTIFKRALHPFLVHHYDSSLHGRMMKLFHSIKNRDLVSERGKRSFGIGIDSEEGRKEMLSFQFTPKRSIYNTFYVKGNFDENSYSYLLDGISSSHVNFHKNAVMMEVKILILVLNFDTLDYKTFESKGFQLDKYFTNNSLELCVDDLSQQAGMKFVFVGLEFYQHQGAGYCLLNEEGAMGLELVHIFR